MIKWREFINMGFCTLVDKKHFSVDAYKESFGLGVWISFDWLVIEIGHIRITFTK